MDIDKILEEIQNQIPDKDQINRELKINTESLWHLEQDIKDYAEVQYRWSRLSTMAGDVVRELELQFEQLKSQVMEEKISRFEKKYKKSFPITARSEMRKSVFTDERVIDKQRELNKAMGLSDYINGLLQSWRAKGFRLGEIANIMARKGFDSQLRFTSSSRDLENDMDEISKNLDTD